MSVKTDVSDVVNRIDCAYVSFCFEIKLDASGEICSNSIYLHVIVLYDCCCAESWITQCGSKLIYELMPGKEVMYVVPVSSILGKLPVVRAGDTGTIPHKYRTALRSGAHRFNDQIARADSRPGAGDGCPMYFVNSWALGWSRDI